MTRSGSKILRREPRFKLASRAEAKFFAASLAKGHKKNLAKAQAVRLNRIPSESFRTTSGEKKKGLSQPILTLAVTGSFGSGKSQALEAFKKLGAAVFSADAIGRELTAGVNRPIFKELTRSFGVKILTSDGTLDRAKLAALVFSSASKRRRLEALLHPVILKELRRRLDSEKNSLRVVEVPLLFESGHEGDYDLVLALWVGEKILRQRLRQKGWSDEDIAKRLSAQMPAQEKCCKADIILDNTTSRQKLFEQVKIINTMCRVMLEDCQRHRKNTKRKDKK